MSQKSSTQITGYDLSSTGTILELACTNLARLGWQIDAGSAADFEVEIDIEGATFTIDSYSSTDRVDDGIQAPEADVVRITNTSTVADTADAGLGGAP